MAYTCSWPCVSDTVPVPTVTATMQQPSSSTNVQQNALPIMTFAAALAGQKVADDRTFDEILVERDGFDFKVEVQYERRPLFCHHCFAIGHNVSTCRWLHPQPPKDKNDRGKQIVNVKEAPPKATRQNIDVGASTSANGSTWTWVPVASTVTPTQRIPVSTTSLASITLDIPTSTTQMDPVSIVPLVVATSQMDVTMFVPHLSSNSFSFPLHNVFHKISPEEFPCSMPVIDIVSSVTHVDVHSKKAEKFPLTSREVLENPTMDDVTVTLSDDVEHNHSSPRELVQSPKGSHVSVSHSSPVEHNKVHDVSIESVQVQTDNVVDQSDVHTGSRPTSLLPVGIERPLAATLPTTIP